MKSTKFLKAGFAAAAALILACQPSYCGVGKTGAQFLKLTPSARMAAMGNAFAGQADDVFAIYANPAGLSQLEKAEFAATYMKYFADVNYGYVGYASKLREAGVIGFGYSYLLVPDIERRDVDETMLGTFNASDISLSLAFAKKDAVPGILENVSLGAAVKIINSQIDNAAALTGAVDVGAMYSPMKDFSTALVLQNIGPGIRFREVTDPLPLNLKLGLSCKPVEKLTLNGDIDEYLNDNKFYAGLGGEYWPIRQLALRAGYRFGYDTASLGSIVGLSAGLGFRIWSMGLDYAFVPFGDLGDTHRVTFGIQF
jgi:hypothetical protein